MFLFIVPCSSIFLVVPLSLELLTMLPLLDFDLKGNLASHQNIQHYILWPPGSLSYRAESYLTYDFA